MRWYHYLCKVTFLLICFSSNSPLFSQFIDLSEKEYPIHDKGLPIFRGVLEIGEVKNDVNNYTIVLQYPEYKLLTLRETKIIQKSGFTVSENINVISELGLSRKHGYLEYEFCPIIKKEGKYYRLSSAKICLETKQKFFSKYTQNHTSKTRWKDISMLSSGIWAKIRVSKEGIYELTPSFLKKMGFDDPSKVKLYGHGGLMIDENWDFESEKRVIDDLEEIPLFRKNDHNLLFFAEGTTKWTWNSTHSKWIHENNPYSKYSYYFLTEGDNPLPFETVSSTATPLNQPVISIQHYSVIDNDFFGWYHGGREMYDEHDFSYGNSKVYKLETPQVDTTQNKSIIDVAFSASSPSSSTTAVITLNNEDLGSLTVNKYGESQSAYESRRSFTYKKKLKLENSLRITTKSNNPSRLNFIRINYYRTLSASDAPYSFSPNLKNVVELQMNDATSSSRLWQIGFAGSPTCEIASKLNGSTLSAIVEAPHRRFVMVDVAKKYPTPEFIGMVDNQNLHADKSLDMVIIIPQSKKLFQEAERLAQFHRESQGLRVKVVDAGQLYNEFSSGTPDASAYRRYLKMLFDRAEKVEDMPSYLLLFGDCAWDNRMLTPEWAHQSPEDYLLSFEVTDGYLNQNNTSFPLGEISSYVTDDFYGWLDDNEGNAYTKNKLDIGIGRFPCNNSATAKILVDKSINYYNNLHVGAWKNDVYVLADYGNENLHMNDATPVIEQIEKSTGNRINIKRVFWDAYDRVTTGTGHTFPTVTKMVQEAMKKGALVFNYTGHGSPDQISHSRIVTTSDFETPGNSNFPLWIMASCEISPFDSQENDIGRAAIHNPTGGAISVICASRSVYSNYNKELNILLNKHLFSKNRNGDYVSMGDALRKTKVELLGSGSVGVKDGSINKLKYVLLGNPALPLMSPKLIVKLDSINGKVIDEKLIQLSAGEVVRFSGHIENERGIHDQKFTGTITGVLADRLEKFLCNNYNNKHADPFEYEERTKIIFEGSDSVRNGSFSFNILIPRAISYSNESGRITFYAVNQSHTLEAHGYCDRFYLNGTAPNVLPDTIAPKVFVYLNSPEFPNGGITTPNPIFIADISDDCGINATNINVGQNMELIVDKNYSEPISMNNFFKYDFGSYQSGNVSYQLNNLTPGQHSLMFKVWDLNGNSTITPLNFYVNDKLSSSFDISITRNPAVSSTDIICNLADNEISDGEVIFEIYNLNGQLVWNDNILLNNHPFDSCITTWNLTTNCGNPVAEGIYLCRAILQSSSIHRTTDAKKIIVVRQ